MNKIDERIALIKKEHRIGLMAHLIIGYPSLSKTLSIAKAMEKGGADFIELQIPFSDPLADGPTIMVACEKALKNGTRVSDAMSIMSKLSSDVKIPLLFMAYYNNVFKYGVEKFCSDAKRAGASGLIVPDIPIEEEHEEHFIRNCRKNGLYSIRVVSPASTRERLSKNSKIARGFMYCTARQGITGSRRIIDPKLAAYLERVRKATRIPLAVGFGISKREHVEILSKHADIAVVGSAIINLIDRSGRNPEKKVERFVMDLAAGVGK